MPTIFIVNTAQDFARALGPHLEHVCYRCDYPFVFFFFKGCRTCVVELYISIADFRDNGDLEVFEKEIKTFMPDKGKKKSSSG